MSIIEIVAGFRDGCLTQVEAAKAIKDLILTERKRCEEICLRYANTYEHNGPTLITKALEDAARDIRFGKEIVKR